MRALLISLILLSSVSYAGGYWDQQAIGYYVNGTPSEYCPTVVMPDVPWNWDDAGLSPGVNYSCFSWLGSDDPCEDEAEGSSWNQENFECDPPPPPPPECTYGSISAECAVDCPELNYSYYQEDVLRYGTITAGQVGYGQQCPEPSFPPNTGGGCVSTAASCDIDGGIHEGAGVGIGSGTSGGAGDGSGDIVDTSTTVGFPGTDSGPGSGGGTTGDGSNQGSGTGGGSTTGTGGLTSNGTATDSDPFCDINGNVGGCLSDDQVNLNGEIYQLCNDGRVANSSGGCDYTAHSCASNQVDTADGCFTIVQSAPPPDAPPTSITTTNTDPVTGITTTTTITSSGTGDQAGEDPISNASLSGNCNSAPSCSGDAINCQILKQEWRSSCGLDDSVSDISCDAAAECSGDPIQCEVLKLQQSNMCELADANQAISQIDGAMSAAGLVDVNAVEDELIANGYERDKEVDVSDSLVDLNSIPTTSGTCPPDITISLGGNFGDITIDMAQFCTFFTWIGYLVRLAAAIFSFNMIFSTIREI